VWDFVGGVVLSTADEKEAPFLAKTGQRVNLPSGSADITQIGRREAPWGLVVVRMFSVFRTGGGGLLIPLLTWLCGRWRQESR